MKDERFNEALGVVLGGLRDFVRAEIRAAVGEIALPLANYPDLLTLTHLAEIRGTSERALRDKMRANELPHCHDGREYYVPKKTYLEWAVNPQPLPPCMECRRRRNEREANKPSRVEPRNLRKAAGY